jgi:hypothetical protein
MKIIERIVDSIGEPGKHDLWLDHSAGHPDIKEFLDGNGWVSIIKHLQDQIDELKQSGGGESLPEGMIVDITEDLTSRVKISFDRRDELLRAVAVTYDGKVWPTLGALPADFNDALMIDGDVYVAFGWIDRESSGDMNLWQVIYVNYIYNDGFYLNYYDGN